MTLDVDKSKSLEVIKFKTNGKKAEGDKKMKDEYNSMAHEFKKIVRIIILF